MSMHLSDALQQAVFARLSSDPDLAALVGAEIHDAAPPGPVPPLYVAIGPERVADRSGAAAPATRHDLSVSVVSDAPGFAAAKAVAGAVERALTATPLAITGGHAAGPWFRRATARRGPGAHQRRIDMIFRVYLAEDE